MGFVSRVFPFGFRRRPGLVATPRVRFEAIAVGSFLTMPMSREPSMDEVKSWLTSDEFSNVTGSDGANAIARLRGRIDFVRDKLLGDQT